MPAFFQPCHPGEFRVRLYNSELSVPDLIEADVCGRFAELLASLVVEFGEVDSRDRPTGRASLNVVKEPLHLRVRDEVQRKNSRVNYKVHLQLLASFLCSRSSSRMPSLTSFSRSLNTPRNSANGLLARGGRVLRFFSGALKRPSILVVSSRKLSASSTLTLAESSE